MFEERCEHIDSNGVLGVVELCEMISFGTAVTTFG